MHRDQVFFFGGKAELAISDLVTHPSCFRGGGGGGGGGGHGGLLSLNAWKLGPIRVASPHSNEPST